MDTNFLVLAMESKVGVREEVERLFGSADFVVLKECLQEATRLGLRERKAVTALVSGLGAREAVGGKKDVDAAIVAYASKHGAAVCTGDAALKKKLKSLGVKVISLRHKSCLGVD